MPLKLINIVKDWELKYSVRYRAYFKFSLTPNVKYNITVSISKSKDENKDTYSIKLQKN